MMKIEAILFDCDGVLAETERDGHRVAYNKAMKDLGIDAEWSVEEYGDLVCVSGGKERLKNYFAKYPWRFPAEKYGPETVEKIYRTKTAIFKDMANRGSMPPRSGIARIAREAHEKNILLFICSTSHRESVEALVRHNYGDDVLSWFTEFFCGDVVPNKKPAPDVYLLVKDKYKLSKERSIVIEDSRNGLLAAKGAGLRCFITQSYYTKNEDFSEADAVVSCLGDPGSEKTEILKPGKLARSDSSRPVKNFITIEDLELLL